MLKVYRTLNDSSVKDWLEEQPWVSKIYPPKWGYAPMNFREVTQEELSRNNMMIYSPVAREFSQIRKDYHGEPLEFLGGSFIDTTLFYMRDGTGWAFSSDYWNKKIRFFVFGCDHNFQGDIPEDLKDAFDAAPKSRFRCQHLMFCRNCGYNYFQDSSD